MTAASVARTAREATIIGSGNPRDRLTGRVFLGFLLVSLLVGFATLAALVVDVLIDGVPHLTSQLLLNSPSASPEKAGARPAILASLYLGILIIAFSVPLGVGTAVYLEEYAARSAGTTGCSRSTSRTSPRCPRSSTESSGWRSSCAASTSGGCSWPARSSSPCVVLPMVIVAAREAIRAVPDSIRQGAHALGATRWQVVWRQVLPASIPGIATGSILSVSRGIGETAPLMLRRRARRTWRSTPP